MRILIFVIRTLPFGDTAWRKESDKWLLYLKTQRLLYICFLLQQFRNYRLIRYQGQGRGVFLSCCVTFNSLAFEHLFFISLVSRVLLLWTPFIHDKLGRISCVALAAVPKDGVVADAVTSLQCFLNWMQYRQDPYVFGDHDICQSFDLASQYSVRSGTRIRVFVPFCCCIIFKESTTEEVASTHPPTY